MPLDGNLKSVAVCPIFSEGDNMFECIKNIVIGMFVVALLPVIVALAIFWTIGMFVNGDKTC
jgi:hypothetical protein